MGCDFHYKCQTNGNVIAWIFILHLLSLWLFFPKKKIAILENFVLMRKFHVEPTMCSLQNEKEKEIETQNNVNNRPYA